jgi:lysophospholipase L1-like esterase
VSKKGFLFGKNMKRLLIYGDSNVYGQKAFDGRLADDLQWPNIVQAKFIGEWKIIQEGLGGRIAGDYDIERLYCNGKTSYEAIARSAFPVDAVIIALGTNDFKGAYRRTSEQIRDDLFWYSKKTNEIAQKVGQPVPTLLYLLPAHFRTSSYFDGDEQLREEVIQSMRQSGHDYIEAESLTLSPDGVHYATEVHEKIAKIVYEVLQKMGDE